MVSFSSRSLFLSLLLVVLAGGAVVGCCTRYTHSFGVARQASVSDPSPAPFLNEDARILLARFSSDGRRLLVGVSKKRKMDLWVTDRSGTVLDSIDWPNSKLNPVNANPQFSPTNASHLLFSSDVRPSATDPYDDASNLYRYDLATDSIRVLTNLPEYASARFATYVPSGDGFLFVYRPPDGAPQLRRRSIQGADTSDVVTSLPPRRWSEAPYDVHPNGESIVYADGPRLVRRSLISGEETVLKESDGFAFRAPRFSPSGSHLLYRSTTRGRGEVLIRLRLADGTSTILDRATPTPSSEDAGESNRFYAANFLAGHDTVVYGQSKASSGGENQPTQVYLYRTDDNDGPVEIAEGLGLRDLGTYSRKDVDVVPTGQQIAASPADGHFVFVGRDSRTDCEPTTF